MVPWAGLAESEQSKREWGGRFLGQLLHNLSHSFHSCLRALHLMCLCRQLPVLHDEILLGSLPSPASQPGRRNTCTRQGGMAVVG